QPVDEPLASANETAGTTEGLAQRSQAGMNASFDAHLLNQSAPIDAKHAGRVRFVDEQHAIVPLGQLRQFVERSQVAVHAEQSFGDDQAAAEFAALAEQFFEGASVAVRVNANLGTRQAAAVDQAGVVFAIGVDRVAP